MKKILFSSLFLVGFLWAQGSQPAEQERAKEAIEQSIDKPKKENLDNLMGKSRQMLKSKNPAATVYSATVGVDVGPDDAQYYDYLATAYSQAVLELKANMILSKSGEIAVNETLEYLNKTMPNDMLNEKLKNEANAKIKELENKNNPDDFFALVGDILKQTLNKNEDNKPKEALIAEAKETIFNKTYKTGFTKEGFDSISGLIPYETFIVVGDDNEVEIGVLAYTTPKSIALARDLAQGNPSKPTENKAQCKDAQSIADGLDDQALMSHLGLKYFYNENCRPSLIAYGMDSFIKESGMNSDYRSESKERARGMADGFIAAFLNSNVNAFLEDTKTQSKVKEAMMTASKQDGKTTYKGSGKNPKTSMVKEMSKDFSSNARMQLIGLEDARVWNVDKGDYEVVGVIRYYSMDSINEANKRFNGGDSMNNQRMKSNATAKGITRSNNLEVDDF